MTSKLFFGLILLMVLAGCGSSSTNTEGRVNISSDFESGNIGVVTRISERQFSLALKDDNNNTELPDNWRNWYYFKVDNIDTAETLTLTIGNRGWNYFYVPVYSYDQKTWFRFNNEEVTQKVSPTICNDPGTQKLLITECSLTITAKYTQPAVYIARFYPYTYEQLSTYMGTIENHECVTISSLGKSPVMQLSIPLITIRCSNSNDNKVAWIHARSHPAEIGPSYLLEGAINKLLADIDNNGSNDSRNMTYFIVPMHNVDGVVLGNYRTNANSINLEEAWLFDDDSLPNLTTAAPPENKLLNTAMNLVNTDFSVQKFIALNLHSSNSPPDQQAFAYPHFGADPNIYNQKQINLWNDSNKLLSLLDNRYSKLVDTTASGGSSFLSHFFPETWWWQQRQDEVLSMTIETTYGTAGYEPLSVNENNLRVLGEALTLAIYDYYNDRNGIQAKRLKHEIKQPISPFIQSVGDKNELH